MSQPGVTLEGVTKRYPGGVTAVDDVSLVIDDGEFVTLVGPSGCGKTTTLRTIAGFETATEGIIGIAAERVNRVPPDERGTGMVFQDFALFPHMTVAENVSYGLRVQGVDDEEIDERVAEMLELVELPGLEDRNVDQLSGGQQQRIALARALAPKPDVLLLDEPLASLDKNLRETMQVELRRIQQELGITTLLVTHNQKEALTMSDRVVVMNDGEFVQVGPPETIYDTPATPFIADFVGNANSFSGTVTAVEDGVATVDCGTVTLTATATDQTVGDDVVVMIRPEKVTLDSSGETGDGTTLSGEVKLTQFTGGQLEYILELDAGPELSAVVAADSIDAGAGDAVDLTLPTTDCLLFEDQ